MTNNYVINQLIPDNLKKNFFFLTFLFITLTFLKVPGLPNGQVVGLINGKKKKKKTVKLNVIVPLPLVPGRLCTHP